MYRQLQFETLERKEKTEEINKPEAEIEEVEKKQTRKNGKKWLKREKKGDCQQPKTKV